MSHDFKLGTIAGAVAMLLISVLFVSAFSGRLARFERQAAVAAFAQKSAEQARDSALTQARLVRQLNDSLERRIAGLETSLAGHRQTIASLRAQRPTIDVPVFADSACAAKCGPALASRDAEIAAWQAASIVQDSLRGAATLRGDSLYSLNLRYAGVIGELSAALDESKRAISAVPRPTFWRRLRPVVTVGYGAQLRDGRVGLGPTASLGVQVLP